MPDSMPISYAISIDFTGSSELDPYAKNLSLIEMVVSNVELGLIIIGIIRESVRLISPSEFVT